jgi:large subunit ribosomal protein L15
MQLHDVHQGIHRRKRRKRIGRGVGSGHGKTSGKGHKGHASRQGFKLSPIFEGGQMPLARRVPKRGFLNGAFKKTYAVVNLSVLEARFEPGAIVDEQALRSRGLVKGQEFDGIKILATGALSKPLEVHATKFSEAAVAKITAAGGKTLVVPYKPHAVSGRPKDQPTAGSPA